MEKYITLKETRQLKRVYVNEMLSLFEEYNANGKKTIAFFCDSFFPYVDGVVSVIDNYAKRLTKYFNVVVCVPGIKDDYRKMDYPVLWFKSIYIKKINYSVGKPYSDWSINALFKKLRVDLIHIHSPFLMGRYALGEAKRRNIPSVATFHSQYKKDFKNYLKYDTLANLLVDYIMYVFNRVNEVWTMNEITRQTLMSYKFNGNVRLMMNATELRPPKDEEAFAKIAIEKFGLKKDEKLFSFVGRLIYLKNIILVAESLYCLKQKGVKFKMIYVGDGVDMPMLKNKITELNLENEVILAGRILDREMLGSILYNSDVHLFPSVYDTDGIVKYEAAAYRTPTLFLKDSCASYDIIDNETGYICEGNPQVIADRLYQILNDADGLKRVGDNAFTKLYHHWDDIIETVAGRYEKLIKMNEENSIENPKMNLKKKKIV